MAGSPPRLWGIHLDAVEWGRGERFTPTPVGNTTTAPRRIWPLAVHPHACGEYSHGKTGRVVIRGSPPRLWGIRGVVLDVNSRQPVHPHACGEYAAGRLHNLTVERFTPTPVGNTAAPTLAARGFSRFTPTPVGNTRRGRRHCLADDRFTPTPVGNTFDHLDHCRADLGSPPRLWGIRKTSARVSSRGGGSPPRLWGILTVLLCRDLRDRFTPTPVGNTPCIRFYGWRCHGSPPRLWGIRQFHERGALVVRFTPTPVGNTSSRPSASRHTSVHPHACGEYDRNYSDTEIDYGSPPRLWGIRQIDLARARARRFTPTPVGNTECALSSTTTPSVHPHACGEYDRSWE